MTDAVTWPVLVILFLGVWHGINPGMGWLFAVALGLQEQERRSVWRALGPLAAGHALAIAVFLLLGSLLGLVVPAIVLKWLVAFALIGFGVSRLIRTRHPRFGGMRISMRRLTVWSFLMASAHGAGLMVLPFVIHTGPAEAGRVAMASATAASLAADAAMSARTPELRSASGVGSVVRQDGAGHAAHLAGIADQGRTSGWIVLLIHTLGYLVAMGVIAVAVYEKIGLRMLRTMWFNLDLIWGVALAATGVIAPFV